MIKFIPLNFHFALAFHSRFLFSTSATFGFLGRIHIGTMGPNANNNKHDNSINNHNKTNKNAAHEEHPIDFNRALPALPLGLCLDLPPTLSLKPTPHHILQNEIPTSPKMSTQTVTSKQMFQDTARELLSPFKLNSQPKICDPSDLLDPLKSRSPEAKKLEMSSP